MMDSPICPACGCAEFDLSTFESMMVLRKDVALYTLRCPHCDTVFSSLHGISDPLHGMVTAAAAEVGAGMGKRASDR